MVCKYWREYELEIATVEKKLQLPAADKEFIRDKIVEAVIGATELIR